MIHSKTIRLDRRFLLSQYDRLKVERGKLLDAAQLAYRKHHLGDENVGWDELGNELQAALCEAMGDKGFQAWLKEQANE